MENQKIPDLQSASFAKQFFSIGKTGFFVICLTISLSCQSLLITYSKKSDNETGYSYDTTTTILLAEILKFFIAGGILIYSNAGIGFRLNGETILYSLPALIYFIQNNLVFVALKFIDPATYQVLVNLKILTTGILFRFVLGKLLSSLQWAGLVLLMVGCATSQIATDCKDTSLFSAPLEGIIICIILSVLSASAGIATEWIMKKSSLKNDPLQRQNMHLYFFGIIFNGLGYYYEKKPAHGFFDGYDTVTVLVVMSYSFTGLIVSVIMKYADNMVKIYAVSVSMALTMVLSIFLFPEFKATAQLLFGIIIISISVLMYFNVVSSDVAESKSIDASKVEEGQSNPKNS